METDRKGRLQDRIAIVTGAGGALGRAIVKMFVKEGAIVSFADINEEQAQETLREVQQQTGRANAVEFHKVDVSNDAQIKQWVDSVGNKHGRIDVVVPNAAAFVFGTVEEASEQDWHKVLAVNVTGYALVCKHAIPHMRKGGGGSIVLMGSQSGFIAQPQFTPYNTSKGAVLQLTRCMAMDYGPENIRVNCVCPGTIETPATHIHAKRVGMTKEELTKEVVKDHFLKRLGHVDDIAYATLFLASNESSFVTGTSLTVDGGNTAH